METVRIPNEATYSPISLTDMAIAAPILSRLVLGATLPGAIVQTAALAVYAGSALQDWLGRLDVRRIDFFAEFGADVHHLEELPRAVREAEMQVLADRLNDGYTTAERPPLEELARIVDRHLTDYIAGITGQRVVTSTEIRTFSLAGLMFPFALGAADVLSGDVAIFYDAGVIQPHVVAHEFTHRKGYWRELDAQALAYLSMAASGDPLLVQSALAERLHRDLRALSGDAEAAYLTNLISLGLRAELEEEFKQLRPAIEPWIQPISDAMRSLYDARMRVTGQNGLSDYDVGFTNFLYTFETSTIARQRPPVAGALR
jgi:hypothetical protein